MPTSTEVLEQFKKFCEAEPVVAFGADCFEGFCNFLSRNQQLDHNAYIERAKLPL